MKTSDKKTLIMLLIAAALLIAVPLLALRGAEFGGSDDAGSKAVDELRGAKPAASDETSGEMQTLFFCLQTGLGVGIIAFFMGRMVERKQWERRNESPAGVRHMSAKALLVVSFGTSHDDTREKTIDRLEGELAKEFPDRRLYRAWTSSMVCERLRREGRAAVDSVLEAMLRMKRDGIRDVLAQPTHVLDGVENGLMRDDALAAVRDFGAIRIGAPLLANDADVDKMARSIANDADALPPDEALLLMGHGTSGAANAMYVKLERRLHELGHRNVFVATVEALPTLDDVVPRLKANEALRRVTLMPLMIVAGDHAKHDMAGEQPGSWRNVLARHGYDVNCVLHGLGESQAVIGLLVEHARQAETEAPI